FERVAASRPDVITAVETDLKDTDKAKLEKLAKTVPPPSGYPAWGVPWDVMALEIGTALDRRADVQKLVDRTRALYAKARSDNPGFEGAKAALISPDDKGGVYIFSEDDVRTRFLSDLGFVMPDGVKKQFKGQFYAQLSAERMDLLAEADALIATTADATQR